jgi:prefoldin subunit 5
MKTTRTTLAIGALVLAVCAVSPIAAADLASLGVTVLSSQPDGARVVYELKDAQGNRLTVVGDQQVTDEQAKAVLYLRDSLTGWKSMKAPGLRVTLNGTAAQALVIPATYSYDGMDFTKLIPSGMQFYLGVLLEYDFRMKVGSIFLRMKGQFFDEDQLGTRMASAARDPVKFLEQTDPEYLYRTLQEVTTSLKGLESGGGDAMQSLHDLIADYQSLKAQKPLLEQKLGELDASKAALTQDLGKLANDYEALRQDHDALQASHDQLQASYDELRARGVAEAQKLEAAIADLTAAGEAEVAKLTQADKDLSARIDAAVADSTAAARDTTAALARLRASVLTLHNTGFLRGPAPMDPKLVARVVDLKQANSAMTSSDILTALKAEGLTATKKQVDIIVFVYFSPGN